MTPITRSDFLNWKQDKVTEAFFDAAKERVYEAKEMLAASAGNDSLVDRFLVGLIQAYTEIQEFRVEDEYGN